MQWAFIQTKRVTALNTTFTLKACFIIVKNSVNLAKVLDTFSRNPFLGINTFYFSKLSHLISFFQVQW